MTKTINKIIPLFVILTTVFFMAGFNQLLTISEVKAKVTTPTVTSGNVIPVASATSLNTGNPINLTENTVKSTPVTGTVTDNNGCQDLVKVEVAVYQDGATCASVGDSDNDTCYFWTDTSPSTDASCTGTSDIGYTVNHNFDLQFYTNPGTWKATITPYDGTIGTPTVGTPNIFTSGVILNVLQALSVSEAISYGTVAAGANSTGENAAVVTDTGNAAIDVELSGTDMTCITRGIVPVGNQQYATSTLAYGAVGSTALSASSTPFDLNLPKPNSENEIITDITYWQVSVPVGTAGLCSGTNTFTARAAL